MAKILLIAGEVSGDMHAAALIQALRQREPSLTFHGIGGDACRSAGMALFHHTGEMEIIGLTEVFFRYRFLKQVLHETTEWVAREQPAAVILVDYPGFNLRLAERIKPLGIPVIYYVCPQVWAWHRARIAAMAAAVDHLITIFPFEAEYFTSTGMRVTFAGHPLVDIADAAHQSPPAALPWQGAVRVALLPGSRRKEIEHNLPVMLKAAKRLEKQIPGVSFLIAAPSDRERAHVESVLERRFAWTLPARLAVVNGQTREVLRQAHATAVASGTATVEAALMNCPMVIVYKVAALTYVVARIVIRVPHIGMVNIIAGHAICPELIQHRATPRAIAGALAPLLDETPRRAAMIEALAEVRTALGSGGAHHRAAEAVLQTIGRQISGNEREPEPDRTQNNARN